MATRPGINPTFDMTVFPPRDQRSIRRFAQHFYITRAADAVQVGNSDYRSFLMRPADELSVVLNVEREILVLFADYQTFEARTLRAFDLIFEQFDDVRVDRSFRILISGDPDIEDIIRHYLSQDPEYPILIPFRYDDFGQVSNDFIFSAVRRSYLIRDLFGYQSPLRQEYFYFGRTQLVEGVIDLHRSGQNSSLFGLRKSGKTSTIFAIQRKARTAGCRTLVIDCQDPAVHARRFGPLLDYILSLARSELNLRKIDTKLGDTADVISEKFRELITRTLNEAGTDLLLIFDEIENISPMTAASAHWRDSNDALLFWQILRSCFQNPSKYKMTFCFVGTNPHLFELPKLGGVDNPVYLFTPKTYIPMLTLPETRDMIARLGYFMGLDFDEKIAAYIHQLFGGHPFFIRQFCSQIHKKVPLNRPRGVSLRLCQETERDSVSDLRGYFDEILTNLRSFYPDEYNMLEYLADGEKETFNEIASEYPAFVEHLLGYGLIVKRGDDHEFAFDAVSRAIMANAARSATSDIESKRTEISRRRNRVEEEIRSALFRWARALAQGDWERIRDRCLTEVRRRVIGGITVNEAFSRRKSPLYLIELLKFVQTADMAVAGYTISDISTAINTVNTFRVDAHAGEITDESFTDVSSALEILEAVFVPPD